jgi:flagellar P-ring protein precursor FlgI
VKKNIIKAFIFGLFIFVATNAFAVRIKDISSIKGIRKNQLVGYGLVVGLNGTGDKSGAAFTMQSLANMIEKMGINISRDSLNVKNVAAVLITAEMPPFARIGSELDIVVSSVGDAKSLSGGTLIVAPLKGVDGQVYALAQGALAIGGAGGDGATKNHLLVARIAGGATVEKEIRMDLNDKKKIIFSLNNPDFTTIMRMTDIINNKYGKNTAHTIDSAVVELAVPEKMWGRVPEFISSIENLDIQPDASAKIVVNEKTGTVIIGENVSISTVAIAHGNLTITVRDNLEVSQPEPFSAGETVITNEKAIEMKEEAVQLMVLPTQTTIGELVKALNAMGVKPRDMISIFQSIKAAGALQADLEVI